MFRLNNMEKKFIMIRNGQPDPLFYVSVASVTDATVAPPGCENMVFLIPVASGLEDDDEA